MQYCHLPCIFILLRYSFEFANSFKSTTEHIYRTAGHKQAKDKNMSNSEGLKGSVNISPSNKCLTD